MFVLHLKISFLKGTGEILVSHLMRYIKKVRILNDSLQDAINFNEDLL